MTKRISTFLRRHRRQVLQSLLVLVVATIAAALVAASRQASGFLRPPDAPSFSPRTGAPDETIARQIEEYVGHLGQFNSLSPSSEEGRLLQRGVTAGNRARAARSQ